MVIFNTYVEASKKLGFQRSTRNTPPEIEDANAGRGSPFFPLQISPSQTGWTASDTSIHHQKSITNPPLVHWYTTARLSGPWAMMTSSETPWLEGSWRVIWVIVDDCHVHPLPGVPGVVHTPAMDPYVSMVRGQCAMLRHATLHCASEPQQSTIEYNWTLKFM